MFDDDDDDDTYKKKMTAKNWDLQVTSIAELWLSGDIANSNDDDDS